MKSSIALTWRAVTFEIGKEPNEYSRQSSPKGRNAMYNPQVFEFSIGNKATILNGPEIVRHHRAKATDFVCIITRTKDAI